MTYGIDFYRSLEQQNTKRRNDETMNAMNERQMEDLIKTALFEGPEETEDMVAQLEEAHGAGEGIEHVQTFEEAGILTCNKGLVVRAFGSEFQITIVRSR